MSQKRLFHISETGNIQTFLPRPSPSHFAGITGDVIFAICDKLLHNYLFPRECPRVTYYAKPESMQPDKEKLFLQNSKDFVIAIEDKWLPAVKQTTLYCYEFPIATFSLLDECAGYYISYKIVEPISVRKIDNPFNELMKFENVKLLVLPELWTLANKVIHSSLNFSLLRMRNARVRI